MNAIRLHSSRVARGSVIVEVHDVPGVGFRPIALTRRAFDLLTTLGTGRCVRGVEIVVARSLAERGLVQLIDDGELRLGGHVDGERWSATLTEIGRVVRDAPLESLVRPARPAGGAT